MLEDGARVDVRRLTKAYARRHADALLAIHNDIPYVSWTADDLLASADKDGCPLWARWQMSLVATHRGEPVGLLIAYLREPDSRHPLESAYIHRLAVARAWRRRGLGTALVQQAVTWYFAVLPWLLTVTSQTNDEASNDDVLVFYRRLTFRRTYRVDYPEKRDILMEVERRAWVPPVSAIGVVPSYAIDVGGTPWDRRPDWGVPTVHFGTSSDEKLRQYEQLARCYGLRLRRLRPVVSLVEPQLEGVGPASEEALVAEPLKWFSRFAARSASYPLMIEDTMLLIERFNRDWETSAILPGADTKRWWQALGIEGVLALLNGSRARRARYVCQLGINSGPGQYRSYRAELEGRIASSDRVTESAQEQFPYSNPTFFHRIFVPEDEDRTLAELEPHEFTTYDYRRRCFEQAVEHLHDSAAQTRQIVLFTG